MVLVAKDPNEHKHHTPKFVSSHSPTFEVFIAAPLDKLITNHKFIPGLINRFHLIKYRLQTEGEVHKVNKSLRNQTRGV